MCKQFFCFSSFLSESLYMACSLSVYLHCLSFTAQYYLSGSKTNYRIIMATDLVYSHKAYSSNHNSTWCFTLSVSKMCSWAFKHNGWGGNGEYHNSINNSSPKGTVKVILPHVWNPVLAFKSSCHFPLLFLIIYLNCQTLSFTQYTLITDTRLVTSCQNNKTCCDSKCQRFSVILLMIVTYSDFASIR